MRAWRRAIPIETAIVVIVGAIAVDVILGACGSTTAPGLEALTVSISASGVSPVQLIGNGPVYVTFVNQDTERHEIRSNPHPAHTDCAEIGALGISPGQRLTFSSTFDRGRTCGYHDETRPDDVRFQGTINIR
jgi:hypothetical protein